MTKKQTKKLEAKKTRFDQLGNGLSKFKFYNQQNSNKDLLVDKKTNLQHTCIDNATDSTAIPQHHTKVPSIPRLYITNQVSRGNGSKKVYIERSSIYTPNDLTISKPP